MELGGWGHSDPKTKFNSIPRDSQAIVPIRSYYFVGNLDSSFGPYRLAGDSENARDSGKEEKKVAELNHRELIEGAERQLAWGNNRRQ